MINIKSISCIYLFAAVLCLTSLITAPGLYASEDSAYRRVLKTSESGLISTINNKPSATSRQAQIKNILDRVPDAIIESPDGKPVSLAWLRNDLKRISNAKQNQWIAEAKKLLSKLQSLRAASSDIRQVNTARDKAAKKKLAAILKRNEYKESIGEQLLYRMLEKFGGFLAGVFGSDAAKYIGWFLAGLLVLVFVVAIVYLVMFIIRNFSVRKKDVKAEKLIESIKTRPSFELMLEKSAREAAEGRYRDAFRSLYLASIIMLDKSNLIVYTDSITNWEYLRVIKKQAPPEAISIFGDMTLTFDILIYGHRNVSRNEYDDGLKQFRKLESLI